MSENITKMAARMAFLPYADRVLSWHDIKNIIASIPAAKETENEGKPYIYAVRLFEGENCEQMAELALGDGGRPNGKTVTIKWTNITEREKYCINGYTFVWDERPAVKEQTFAEYTRKERNIMEVARLFRVLESRDSVQDKANAIKLVRDNGDITPNEALELAIEYCYSVL